MFLVTSMQTNQYGLLKVVIEMTKLWCLHWLCYHGNTYMFVCVCVCVCLVTKSHLTLCDPMDSIPPGFSVHEISQASILEWFATSSSRESSWCMDQIEGHSSLITSRVTIGVSKHRCKESSAVLLTTPFALKHCFRFGEKNHFSTIAVN